MNRAGEARSLLEEALRLDSQQADAREGMGVLAWREEKEGEARRWLGGAVRLPSASALAHYSYAMLLLRPPRRATSAWPKPRLASRRRSPSIRGSPTPMSCWPRCRPSAAPMSTPCPRLDAARRGARARRLRPSTHRGPAAPGMRRGARRPGGVGGRLAAGGRSEEERGAARSFLASLSSPAAGLAPRDTPALVRILEKRCDSGATPTTAWSSPSPPSARRGRGRRPRAGRAALREGLRERHVRGLCGCGLGLRAGRGRHPGTRPEPSPSTTRPAQEATSSRAVASAGSSLPRASSSTRTRSGACSSPAKACDGGQILACNTVGVIHVRRQEYGQAVRPFTRCCDAGEAVGCGNLALLHEQGRGVRRDPPRAVALPSEGLRCGAGIEL